MQKLGKLTKIDLRSQWENEPRNFSRWLAEKENLKELGRIIGIDEIELVETESNVGGFSVDIYAQDKNSEKNIVIENQLEKSDHDHLGKLITYASGKDAQIIIWIVKEAREEHINAVSWLNEKTDLNINFFLLEIELWKIGDSLPAPKFNVVVKPNEWARVQKEMGTASDSERLKIAFWQYFVEKAFDDETFSKLFNRRTPSTRNWYSMTSGIPGCEIFFRIAPSEKRITAGCYIKGSHADQFDALKERQNELKELLPDLNFQWKVMEKDRLFCAILKTDDLSDQSRWINCVNWFMNVAQKLKTFVNE